MQQKMKKLRRHIPEEIITLVLERLPVKSLLRFKCVNKSWYHLIRSPSFVTAHSNCQKKYLLVGSIDVDYYENSTCIHSSSLSLRFDEVQCKEYYRIHQEFEEYYKMRPDDAKWCSRIHWYAAASHGLICYTNEDLQWERDIFLWNPAIRKLKILPSPPRHPGGVIWITLAFGYCQKANDFKVVKILESCEDNYTNQKIEAEVYSLNTNSWKTISEDNLIGTSIVLSSKDDWVFLNGKAYFRGLNLNLNEDELCKSIIVCYDTDEDIMREIPSPETKKNNFLSRPIRVLNGSLVYFTGKRDENSFDMWVLKQGGNTNKFCWEKKINVDLGGINKDWEVFGIRSNGEIVLHESSENGLISYDVEKDEEKDFADSWDKWFEPGRRLSLRVDSFSESLVLIDT